MGFNGLFLVPVGDYFLYVGAEASWLLDTNPNVSQNGFTFYVGGTF